MNETNWKQNSTESNSNSKLHRAEEAVTGSIDKLEHVMEDITEKVEDTSHKIQHMVDLGVKQKDELAHLAGQTKEKIMPIFNQSRDFSRQVVSQVRRDPRSFMLGALALVGGIFLLSYIGRRSSGMGAEMQSGDSADFNRRYVA